MSHYGQPVQTSRLDYIRDPSVSLVSDERVLYTLLHPGTMALIARGWRPNGGDVQVLEAWTFLLRLMRRALRGCM